MELKKVKNVVYACNDSYVEQTLISIISLLKHNDYFIKIWIVSDGISETNKKLIASQIFGYNAELNFFDIEEILKDVHIVSGFRHPKTIYVKLFLEEKIDADKLLYLDSDTVINGDLSPLWQRDMKKELVAGVQMPYSPSIKAKMKIKTNSPYLCDGVVMLNLNLWREHQIGTQCRQYISACNGIPQMQSEGTLNYVCQDYIGVLEPKYNVMPQMLFYKESQIDKLFRAEYYYLEEELREARNQPVIVHFVKELYNRPWCEPCNHPLKLLYRNERRKLFGEKQYVKEDISFHTKLTKVLYYILPFKIYAELYHLKQEFMR